MVHKPIIISVIAPMTVAGILIMTILANQAFAQAQQEEKCTALTLDVSPDTKGASSYTLTGKLTCEGSSAGKTIVLTSTNVNYFGRIGTAVTGPDGTFSFTTTKPLERASAWYLNGPIGGGIPHSVTNLR
jgi:hypothetical protein